ncbi:hypothetical protein [Streptomyces sp. Iso 434]|uniref:hypothetical protein n=1 Tax=Streptomyces sp. Iso 434 TaxID=3062272 RepID=UPI0039810A73
MPSDYRSRRGDVAVVESWIIQGANRLGLESLYRLTSLHRGYRKARISKYLSAAQKRAEAQRFPDKARFDRADQMASNSILDFRPSAEALARSKQVEFDGGCPKCQGAGELWGLWVIDLEAEWYEEGYRPCWACRDSSELAISVEFMGAAA